MYAFSDTLEIKFEEILISSESGSSFFKEIFLKNIFPEFSVSHHPVKM